ncbi:MAG TPA: energy transducer TonB [Steroidobacteraceae bacterium]|nr:energy transducer TonB [Steroidobacteraceae bacterium]
MRLIFGLLVAASAATYSLAASADCTRPRPAVTIPDGSSATEQGLLDAHQKLREFDRQVGAYQSCLAGEVSQKSVGKDEATRQQLAAAQAAAHNEAADELSALAACLQAQIEAFKTSGGGTENKPAACDAFKGKSPTSGAPPQSGGSSWIKEADGRSTELPGGVWSFSLYRDDSPRACGENNAQACLVRMLYVLNGADQALECTGSISYAGADIAGRPTTEYRALVPEKSSRGIVVSAAERSVNASTFDANCTPRAALPPLDTPATCKYEVVQPVSISDYYPEESRSENEEGPVVVEFTLKGKADHPADVKVAASSLFPRIDAAAVKAVGDMVMSSSCKNSRYRLRLTFKLQ